MTAFSRMLTTGTFGVIQYYMTVHQDHTFVTRGRRAARRRFDKLVQTWANYRKLATGICELTPGPVPASVCPRLPQDKRDNHTQVFKLAFDCLAVAPGKRVGAANRLLYDVFGKTQATFEAYEMANPPAEASTVDPVDAMRKYEKKWLNDRVDEAKEKKGLHGQEGMGYTDKKDIAKYVLRCRVEEKQRAKADGIEEAGHGEKWVQRTLEQILQSQPAFRAWKGNRDQRVIQATLAEEQSVMRQQNRLWLAVGHDANEPDSDSEAEEYARTRKVPLPASQRLPEGDEEDADELGSLPGARQPMDIGALNAAAGLGGQQQQQPPPALPPQQGQQPPQQANGQQLLAPQQAQGQQLLPPQQANGQQLPPEEGAPAAPGQPPQVAPGGLQQPQGNQALNNNAQPQEGVPGAPGQGPPHPLPPVPPAAQPQGGQPAQPQGGQPGQPLGGQPGQPQGG